MGFGFLDITLVDIIDIFVVALIMFQVYRLTRGTNALRIVVGILIIYLLWIVTRVLNMVSLWTLRRWKPSPSRWQAPLPQHWG